MRSNTMKSCYLFVVAAACVVGQLSAQTLADYQAEVMSQGPSSYFKLDGSLESAVNPSETLINFGGGYNGDVFRNTTNSYFFANQADDLDNLTDPLINGGGDSNINANATGSISFLFRTLPGINTGQRYLFSAGKTTANANAFSVFIENNNIANGDPNSLKLRIGDGTTTILQASNMPPNTWHYLAITYDEARTNLAAWHVGKAGGTLSTGMVSRSAASVVGEGVDEFALPYPKGLVIGNTAEFNDGFRNPGAGRIDEFAIWARELTTTEINDQFAKLPQPAPPGATYQEVVDSQIPKYYFKLDDSLIESVGNTLALSTNGSGGFFTTNVLGDLNSAYTFTSTNDALTITNDLFNGGGPSSDTGATGAGTISFQFRMLSETTNTGQRFLFAAPATESGSQNNTLTMFLENPNGVNPHSLKIRVGGSTFGNTSSSDPANHVPVAYATNLVPDAWYYFALVYDETGNGVLTTYFGPVGGTLVKHEYNPNNDNVVGNNGPLAIGNRTEFTGAFRNPGEGVIDEFAIWHDMLTDEEIGTQFDAVLSTPAGPPSLNIAQSGSDVVLSWTTNDTAAYSLEATPTLTPAAWAPEGTTPTIVGDEYQVTNSATGGETYYRLTAP